MASLDRLEQTKQLVETYSSWGTLLNNTEATKTSVERIEFYLFWILLNLSAITLILFIGCMAYIGLKCYLLFCATANKPSPSQQTTIGGGGVELTPMLPARPTRPNDDLRKKQISIAAPGVTQPPSNIDDIRNAGGL